MKCLRNVQVCNASTQTHTDPFHSPIKKVWKDLLSQAVLCSIISFLSNAPNHTITEKFREEVT